MSEQMTLGYLEFWVCPRCGHESTYLRMMKESHCYCTRYLVQDRLLYKIKTSRGDASILFSQGGGSVSLSVVLWKPP